MAVEKSGARDLSSAEEAQARREAGKDGEVTSNENLEGSLRVGDKVFEVPKEMPSVPLNPRTNPEWNKWSQDRQMEEWQKYQDNKTKFEVWQKEHEMKEAA